MKVIAKKPYSLKKLAAHIAIATTLMGVINHASAHGGAATMVPLKKTLEAFGAKVNEDKFSNVITIVKNSTYVQVKPNSNEALVNNQPLKLSVPITMKKGVAYSADGFINEVFQSGLDKTFVIEQTPHPLNPLSKDEINTAFSVIKASPHYKPNLRFTEIKLKEPDKKLVWDLIYNPQGPKPKRQAEFVILDGSKVFEGSIDLASQQITSWQEIQNKHGMLLVDDFATVQNIIYDSPAYAQALAKRGILDPKKVVATPLTAGYFGGEDELPREQRLLKVVAYLDTGDGNYWAHPIENLVAVVDLEKKQVIKIEDAGVIPVPMVDRPYDGRNKNPSTSVKPLHITEPEGKNYTIAGNMVHWQNWCFHLKLDSRVGLMLSTVTYKNKGVKRKIMYEGSLGGMVVPYGDPDIGWYFKSYLDSGEYGMGTLTSSLERGTDVPENAVLMDAVIADYQGKPITIPNAIAVFERYAGPEFKHQEYGQKNVSTERRELVVRWVSTVGNYDYIFDWVLGQNGTMGINAGATGIEAVKGVKSKSMHDATAKEDTRYGTLIDHNTVGTTHQHIYNFRLDLDIDGENNTITEVNPMITKNIRGGPRHSTMETTTRVVSNEADAAQKFDPSTVRLLTNPNKENKVGNPVSYQIIPYAGGTHPIAKGANFSPDEWLFKRLNFMDKQIWVTRYNPDELYPEGKYPNRSEKDEGLGHFIADSQSIENTDDVVWLTTGTTHIARAEEWPIMPTEWVNVLLKPWNFFDETPTLDLNHQHTK